MSDGGKGSSPRPYSVSSDQFASNWDLIWGNKNKKQDDNTGVTKNEYQDVLQTEDAVLQALHDENERLGLYKDVYKK